MVSPGYLAGFIDGEGHLSLGKIPRHCRSTEFPLRVVVYNTNLEILKEVQAAWGGILSDSGSRNPRWKPGRALIWTNAAAASVLVRVAPHLRVKSRQASKLLRFHKHIRSCRRLRDRRGQLLPLSKTEYRFRDACHKRIKQLNARGRLEGALSRRNGTHGHPPHVRAGSLPIEYLAGFVDGEGSLMITRWKGRGSGPHHRPRISISNTNRSVLEDIQRAYGGILTYQDSRQTGWKESFQLVWTNGMVEKLLAELSPDLRLKREQAAVMMEFIRHQKTTPRVRQGPNGRFFAPLLPDVIAYRESLYNQMRGLNAKGPSPVFPHAGANLNPYRVTPSCV